MSNLRRAGVEPSRAQRETLARLLLLGGGLGRGRLGRTGAPTLTAWLMRQRRAPGPSAVDPALPLSTWVAVKVVSLSATPAADHGFVNSGRQAQDEHREQAGRRGPDSATAAFSKTRATASL
jgi:hypothetical protein